MKGNGNGIKTLLRKLRFMLIPTSGARSKFIMDHANEFAHVGEKLFFQPRKYPSDPELIWIGDNVNVASDVSFINHDIIHSMLNKSQIWEKEKYNPLLGCIKIGDNVMIGTKTIIMPNVLIGSNVIIAAGSIVTKDIPDNSIAAGIPAKVIAPFGTIVEKKKTIKNLSCEELWHEFNKIRNK